MSDAQVVALQVESAKGPLDTSRLGRTLMHEHVFTVETEMAEYHPHLAWNGTREARIDEAVQRLTELQASGIDTLVDMNVLGLGRSMPDVLAVARRVELNILLATGVYPQHGLPGPIAMREPRIGPDGRMTDVLTEIFVRDIEEGIAGSGVRASLIKGYTDQPGVTPLIDRCLRAVATAHRQTGVPINTHTDARAEVGLEQQRVFREEGVDLTRVVIGHSGDTTDVGYLRKIMDEGSLIASDRFGLYFEGFPDMQQRVGVIAELCRLGYSDRIVLSHDTHCYADYDFAGSAVINRETLPRWVLNHLVEDVLPAMRRAGVTDEQIDQMLVANPRRVFERQNAY